MKRAMNGIIHIFEPAYHSLCKRIWGADITQVLSRKWEMSDEKVHEHIMAWSLMANFVFILTTAVLIVIITN